MKTIKISGGEFPAKLRWLLIAAVLFALGSCSDGATQGVAQAPTAEYAVRWADGQEAPIALATDYVAVRGNADRLRSAAKGLATEVTGVEFGVRGIDISIGRVDKGQRNEFMREMRTSDVNVVGIPIRSSLDPEAPVVAVATNEFIVRFSEKYPRDAVDEINEKMGAVVVRQGSGRFKNQYVLRAADSSAATALALTNRYFDMDSTVYAHPNFLIKKVARNNDPLLDDQWHLKNTGQSGGKVGADSRAVEAWQVTKGAGTVIAVIDPDGVEMTHDDLKANRFINPGESGPGEQFDGDDNDGNGLDDDWSGWNFNLNNNNPATSDPHGTAAAGVAAASCNNDEGGCGVAPEAKILGIAQGGTVADDASAFLYANSMGADIISNSWGYPLGLLQRPTDAVEDAIDFVATDGRGGKGVVVLFAMTNEKVNNFTGSNPDISSLDSVIAVGRSTNLDRWGHSGFGQGMKILGPTNAAKGSAFSGCVPNDLAGTLDVTTTDMEGNAGYNDGSPEKCVCNPSVDEIHSSSSYTACFGGTSSATPLVAGVAALVLSVNPALTRQQVVDILIDSADKIDSTAAGYTADSNGRLYSTTHGFGRVNAAKAVELAEESLQEGPRAPNAPELVID